MNGALYHHLNKNKSNLHDELDETIRRKEQSNLDDELGVKITATTREKILISLINIFKLIRHSHFDTALKEINFVVKRMKIHFNQLRKLDQNNYITNVKYFTDLMKVCYSIIINCKRSNKIR